MALSVDELGRLDHGLFSVQVSLFSHLLRYLLFELSPFLLGPAELLHRRGEIQEMDGDDGGSRPQIGVADEGVQLPAGLDQTGVDLLEAFSLLRGVAAPMNAQDGLLDVEVGSARVSRAYNCHGDGHKRTSPWFYPPPMLDEAVVTRVLAEAASAGADLAEIYVEERRSSGLRLEDGRIEDVVSGRDKGAGIRVLTGDKASYAHTNLLDERSLLEAARAARAGTGDPRPVAIADLRRVEGASEHPVRLRPEDVPAGNKAEALKSADEAARAAGAEVRQVVVSYMDVHQKVLIASSDGSWATDDRTRVRFATQVVAGRDGNIATGFRAPGHSGGYELLDERPAAEIGAEAATKALRMLDARPAPAGEFPVVLAPGTGGVLIHEACGHGLEGDTLAKDASVYAGRVGERFGSDSVTIVDDGTDRGAWGSFGVDDEGAPAHRTILFEKGVLVGHMNDRRSAAKLEAARSGNGRRQSYAHLPIVRMTNTYLLPGPDDREEILRSVQKGVYAAGFAGGEVNPATGNFVFGMSEAYWIENGELAYPIKGANLIGNGPQVLNVIDAVAADFDRWEGVCGKDGQHAPVTNGMPTVLLGRMTVGGTEA